MAAPRLDFSRFIDKLDYIEPVRQTGKVTHVIGIIIESLGPTVSLGELCFIHPKNGGSRPTPVKAEVVGFRDNKVLLMALGVMEGISPGSAVEATGHPLRVAVGDGLRGRIINGLGQPMDGLGPLKAESMRTVEASPPHALKRRRITETMALGVRAVDGALTIGRGQRIGIFSGSGIGKSTLMGMIARNTEADLNVIGLIGERGREVRDFLEKDLGEDGLKRSVVVVATSDQPPLVRIKGALVTTTIAEYFRDRGHDVVMMMDSVTRFALSQREVGLAVGEPPATRGYTPSVFSMIPKILERSGTSDRGSITGLYNVLVEADDMNEPVSDTVRGTLDGHIVLSRKLAHKNHYPAIDVLQSISRLMIDIVDREQMAAARRMQDLIAVYNEAEDLINIGAYVRGSNPRIDEAISKIDEINEYLRQSIEEKADFNESVSRLIELTQ